MGFFDWLTGEKRLLKRLPDRVWMSSSDMQRQFAQTIQPLAGKSALTLVATHFQKSLEELRGTLGGPGGKAQEITHPGEWSTAIRSPRPVLLLRADLLQRVGLPALPGSLDFVNIIVYGRHPLREKDDEIATFGERFEKPGQITFHTAIDDPLLRIFVTDTVKNFLQSSAKGSDPWLESAMVSRSIEKAQARIREKQIGNQNAESIEDWLAKNVQK
jgi:hypothetical protein